MNVSHVINYMLYFCKQGELGQVLARREVRNVVDQQEEAKYQPPDQMIIQLTVLEIKILVMTVTVRTKWIK